MDSRLVLSERRTVPAFTFLYPTNPTTDTAGWLVVPYGPYVLTGMCFFVTLMARYLLGMI